MLGDVADAIILGSLPTAHLAWFPIFDRDHTPEPLDVVTLEEPSEILLDFFPRVLPVLESLLDVGPAARMAKLPYRFNNPIASLSSLRIAAYQLNGRPAEYIK